MQVVQAGPLKVMIMGAPAAGKGTQCEKIVHKVPLCCFQALHSRTRDRLLQHHDAMLPTASLSADGDSPPCWRAAQPGAHFGG